MTHTKVFKKYYIAMLVADKDYILDYRHRGRIRRSTLIMYQERLPWKLIKNKGFPYEIY